VQGEAQSVVARRGLQPNLLTTIPSHLPVPNPAVDKTPQTVAPAPLATSPVYTVTITSNRKTSLARTP